LFLIISLQEINQKKEGDKMENKPFELDLNVQQISTEEDVLAMCSDSGWICTPTCKTGTINCKISLSACSTCEG
jgi:hypothetical protein